MLSQKALKNIEKAKKLAERKPDDDSLKFLKCSEHVQVFNWNLTNRKATYRNYEAEGKIKIIR